MHWTLSTIEAHLLERPSDQKVASLLNKIKNKYLEEKGENIFLDSSEVAAYSMFYMPTNARKFNFVWEQLPAFVQEDMASLPFVDFGCGPGTYIWPALSLGFKGPFYGIDSNEEMIKQARKFGEGLFPEADYSFSTSDKGIDRDEPKTLFFGNSLNEMPLPTLMSLIERFNAKYIFFIEPGTSKVFKKVIELRKTLIERRYEVHFPCGSVKNGCPVEGRLRDEKEDWCHQVLREVHHPSIERLGQMAKMDRKVQPYISHVYELDGINKREEGTARFVRYLTESKYAFNWEVCLFEQGLQKIVEFEIVKKSMDKRTAKEFKKLSIGHEVKYSLIKEMSETKLRVSVELLNGN